MWFFNDTRARLPVVKKNKQCWNRAMQKFCPYWIALQDEHGKVAQYRCRLFDQEKPGYTSLKDCDDKYGSSYDGPP